MLPHESSGWANESIRSTGMKALGINFSNDAAAALVVDGRVVAAVQEERLSRIKHDPSFPARAVRYCLDHSGLTLRDVDAVGFFWNPGIHAQAATRRRVSQPEEPSTRLRTGDHSVGARVWRTR